MPIHQRRVAGERRCECRRGDFPCARSFFFAEASGFGDRGFVRARRAPQGWGEAKIARAIEQRAEAKSRPPRPRAEPEVTSLRVWRELIEAVLASRATPSLGLVLHGMDHPNDFEDFPVCGRERIARKQLSETVLASMRDDTLYDFAR